MVLNIFANTVKLLGLGFHSGLQDPRLYAGSNIFLLSWEGQRECHIGSSTLFAGEIADRFEAWTAAHRKLAGINFALPIEDSNNFVPRIVYNELLT